MTTPARPSLSVLLPCRDDAQLLPRQIDAILSQLSPDDELLLLDDGSRDGTLAAMRAAKGPQVVVRSLTEPMGAAAAYNHLARRAGRDWLLAASSHDLLQPGAVAAWRKLPPQWPNCRIIFGPVVPDFPLQWEDFPRLFSRDDLACLCWQVHGGHHAHRTGAFIRRDSWGRGYGAGCKLAGWWHGFQIAARHGAGYMPYIVSMDEVGRREDARGLAEIVAEIRTGRHDDIYEQLEALDTGLYEPVFATDGDVTYRPKLCWLEKKPHFPWFERGA
jgi:glycosyltransferase involved in cell wall biosynthesis